MPTIFLQRNEGDHIFMITFYKEKGNENDNKELIKINIREFLINTFSYLKDYFIVDKSNL